jgi:signal transduction histidine kinase
MDVTKSPARDEVIPVAEHGPGKEPVPAQEAVYRLAALGEMTGGIVHDIRNILGAVDSGLRLAERNASDPEKLRDFIAATHEALGRGLELTNRLLRFASHHEPDFSLGDVNALLRDLAIFLKYAAGPDLQVVMQLGDVPKCPINTEQFSAAILNLVVNARDAASDQGKILISTERYVTPSNEGGPLKTYVRVCVRDDGRGMSAETLQHIFDPFFTTKGFHGTGLGLPQVRAFMLEVGGQLNVVSNEGEGTLVELLFPVEKNNEAMQTLHTNKPADTPEVSSLG